MALSRLLLPKSRLHFHTTGLLKPTRWYSNSSSTNGETEKSSKSKKSGAAKERRAVAVESYVKKYVEMHSGVFPKATQVQNRVGGSWYTLKDILNNLKEKMLGNSQLQNHITSDTSDSTVDTKDSKLNTTHNSPDNNELDEPKSTVMNSHSNEKNISTSSTCHIMGENSSADIVDTTASEVINMHSNPDNTELGEPKSIVQSSEVAVDSCSNEKSISATATDMVRSEDVSDSSKLVEPENGHGHGQLEEELSGILASFDRDQKAESEHLSHLKLQLLSDEATRALIKDCANKLISVGNGNHQPEKKITTSGQTPNAVSKMDGTPASFGSAKKGIRLADLFMRTMNDIAAGEMAGKKSYILASNRLSEHSNEASGEDMAESDDIRGLIDCIKVLPREQSVTRSQSNVIFNKTHQVSNTSPVRRIIQSRANLQKTDNNKGRQTFLKGHTTDNESNKFKESKEEPSTGVPFKILRMDAMSEDEEGSDLNVAAFDCIKSEPSPQVHLPPRKENPDKSPDTCFIEKGSDQNKVLVRFLYKTTANSDIVAAFKDCGPIEKILGLSPIEGSIFRDAYIYFKTREGLQKALAKTDMVVTDTYAFVEATSSSKGMPNRISIPSLIGDPDVPVALVKNPTRTVMIKQLTPDISSHHIKEALAFCKSGISGFILGYSSSVAYVEFETEDAKERALAKHSIRVLGKQLMIFRIDAPRTTVVRISNIKFSKTEKNVNCICDSYGQVKNAFKRLKDTVDVHFKLAEWPNMLKILNSLNGMEVDGYQWHAQPATVFPPEILRVLWSQPDERRHVKAQIQSLLQNLGEDSVNTAGLTNLVAKYYGDGF